MYVTTVVGVRNDFGPWSISFGGGNVVSMLDFFDDMSSNLALFSLKILFEKNEINKRTLGLAF